MTEVSRARRSAQRSALPAPGSQAALRAIKAIKVIHTLAWFSIEASMVRVLYAGFARRSDRRAGIAAAVVAGESLIFAANGFRCPLTKVAERLGAERGSVTDIWLPRWFRAPSPCDPCPADGHGRVPVCEKLPGQALTWPDVTGGREPGPLASGPTTRGKGPR